MFLHTEAEGLAVAAHCMAAYDECTAAACESWSRTLPDGMHNQGRLLIEAASAAAVRRWRSWCEGGEEDQEEDQAPAAAQTSRRPGTAVVPDAGLEDPEHRTAAHGSGAPRLQRNLVRLADACIAQGLLNRSVASGAKDRVVLLRELCSVDCSHEWLWSVC